MFNKINVPKQIITLLILFIILSAARVLIFNSNYYVYLFWNIFLAILPFIISLILLKFANNKKLTKPLLIIGGIFWLLLLPNAPYVVTDLIHLNRSRGAPLIYDVFLVFSCAWTGLLLGLYSISHIEKIIRLKYKAHTAAFIIAFIILLTSFGMYLGRFLRFNSWDIFSSSPLLFNKVTEIFAKPAEYEEAYIFTGLSFVFIYLSYRSWKYSRAE